jgi:hypothetical protein
MAGFKVKNRCAAHGAKSMRGSTIPIRPAEPRALMQPHLCNNAAHQRFKPLQRLSELGSAYNGDAGVKQDKEDDG